MFSGSVLSRTPVPQTLEGQRSGSRNAQATSSNTGPAMFDSATNAMITGGHFTASQGNHANVTINISDSRIPRTSGAQVQIQNQPGAQNVVPSPNPNPSRNRRRRRPNRPEANMIRPVQRSNEMYEQHLLLKNRGFPLWIPQPNVRLPIPYRAKGVCIGDVGIVTSLGGFDFLFNICRERGDPINPEELPDKFVPIDPALNPTDVREFREFGIGSYLASSSIVKSQTGEQIPGLTFESSASEGAILTMPDGAFQEELGNLSRFRDYVAVHAANWYKFVNGPRGREARNGDVIVVIGCDKTTSWGMATFANTSSAQQSNFRLTFRPLQSQHNAGTAYAWEHSGVAEVRVGPDPGENEELGETPTSQLRNQCLFMRTLSVTLSDSEWAETFPGTVSASNQEGSQPEYRGQCLHPPNPNTSSSSSNSARSIQGGRRSRSEIAEEDKEDKEGSTLVWDPSWSSAPAKESVPSSSGYHVGSAGSSDTHDSDGIKPYVDKLYHMTNNLKLAKCITWTNSGTSFIVDLQIFPESLMLLLCNDNFSDFVRQLNMYGFQVISRISPPNHWQDQTWEFSHPKFIRGRPDLLHEIKLNDLEPHWNPAMKDELLGDLVQAPTQFDAMQNEITRVWVNPSKIINKYLLSQVPDAKVALTHDRNWSAMTCLSPSELIKQITLVNEITVDSVSRVVFLEPKNEISPLTVEKQTIFDQIEGGKITVEQYLFGSSENHSLLLHNLIDQLRSDYMPFCDQYTMPAKETPRFLKGHPKRLLSLDDLVDIHLANFQSVLEHQYIHRLRSQLNALLPDDPDKGTWLLRLADVLSRRFWQLDQKDDLEEAIWYYQEALSLLPQTHYHFLEAILGVCSCVYQRFQLLGHLDDLKKLLEYLHTEQNLNLESLLIPVKAQLQPRPQQLTPDSNENPPGYPGHPSSSSVYLQEPTGSTTSTIHPKRGFSTDAVAPKQRDTGQQPYGRCLSDAVDVLVEEEESNVLRREEEATRAAEQTRLDLELATRRLQGEELEKREKDAKRKEGEAKRLADQAALDAQKYHEMETQALKMKEKVEADAADTQRRVEELALREAEAREREEGALQRERGARQREIDILRREEQAKLAAELAPLYLEQARLQGEELEKREKEVKEKEEEAKRLADESKQAALDAQKRESEAKNLRVLETQKRETEARKDADEARAREEQVQKDLQQAKFYLEKVIQPEVWPTEEEFQLARNRVQYDPEKLHFAVCGSSGSGKSSLINAFRGLKNKDPQAARTGVVETTNIITRYPDPRKELPYERLVWFDCPGAGTLEIPGWQYFNQQGLFIFDIILLVYDACFTEIDLCIIRNCERFKIPLFIVRSKADIHIRNAMQDLGYDEDEEDAEDDFDDYQSRARQYLIDTTRKNLEDNLEKAGLNKYDVFIVSSSVIFSLVTAKTLEKTTPAIDESRLMESILNIALARRNGTQASAKNRFSSRTM